MKRKIITAVLIIAIVALPYLIYRIVSLRYTDFSTTSGTALVYEAEMPEELTNTPFLGTMYLDSFYGVCYFDRVDRIVFSLTKANYSGRVLMSYDKKSKVMNAIFDTDSEVISVNNEYVLIKRDNWLWCSSIKTGISLPMLSTQYMLSYIVSNRYVFYTTDDYYMYSYDLVTKSRRKLCEYRAYKMVCVEGDIFFSNMDRECNLSKYNIETGEITDYDIGLVTDFAVKNMHYYAVLPQNKLVYLREVNDADINR